jgi:hypothetical protein
MPRAARHHRNPARHAPPKRKREAAGLVPGGLNAVAGGLKNGRTVMTVVGGGGFADANHVEPSRGVPPRSSH